MRIIITEKQLDVLVSPNVEGLEELMSQITNKFPEVEDYKDKLVDFINKSNCKKIEFANMQHAGGLSLHNSVLINKILLKALNLKIEISQKI